MKTYFKNMTLKTKLLTVFGFVLAVLCAQGAHFLGNLSSVNEEMNKVVHKIQPALLASKTLSEETNQASSSLGFYLLSKEESHHIAYMKSIKHLNQLLVDLSSSVIMKDLKSGEENIKKLSEQIHVFSSYSDKLNTLATNEGENIIATKYATDNVNPTVIEISQLLSQAIIAEEDEDVSSMRKKILADLNELRYTWSTLINEMRLFLAFRTPAAKENMETYLDKFSSTIKTVAEHGDDLAFEQANAIEQIENKFSVYKNNLKTMVTMHESKKWRTDSWLIREEIQPLLNIIHTEITELTVQLEEKSEIATVSVNATYEEERNLILIGTAIMFLIISALCWVLIRNIINPITTAVKVANTISSGDLSSKIESDATDETGQLLNALQSMQANLKERIEAEQSVAVRSQRLKQALNSVDVNVMNIDMDNTITFVNTSLSQLFHDKQTSFQTHLSSFDADNLVDTNLDTLIKDSDLLSKIDNLKSAYSKDCVVGDLMLRLVINPIFDEDDKRVGTVIEWDDRTQEIAIEEEIQEIVEASLSGDLSQRIELSDKSGFFEKLSRGVNEMVDVSERIINDTVKVLGAMSHGDLTKTITANYHGSFGQLKNDANSTIAKLTEVMGDINENANSVLNGAQEIAQGNANLSQRTEEQASSLEETASSMEEMTSTVRMNADNAKQADQLSSSARELAEKGGEVVSNAVDAMSEITASSKKIADIIGVIDEIAFQTNLLALNAAVEAARAGEQGRGFAVVASEVRNLAGRSATAAKEIKGLIGDSVTKVEEGSKLVDESGKTLEGIMISVKKVSDIIAEIAAAGEEQSDGIEQVNKAINQMDEMTQQNATLVEQAAAASEAMGEQARNLNELVGFFTTDGASNNANSTERRSGSRPWKGDNKPAVKSGGNGLDFSAARIKHLSWKTRLRSFLDGQESMSKDQAVSHHDCDLGKWLYSTGMESYGHMPEMKTLEKVHAELHGIIKDVVRLKHDGDAKGAEKKFAKVESISGKIVAMLNHIESDVKSGAGGSASAPEVTAPIQKTGTDDDWDEF